MDNKNPLLYDREFQNKQKWYTAPDTYTFSKGKGIDGSVALRRELTKDNDQGYNKCQALNDGQSSLKLNANTTYLMRIH